MRDTVSTMQSAQPDLLSSMGRTGRNFYFTFISCFSCLSDCVKNVFICNIINATVNKMEMLHCHFLIIRGSSIYTLMYIHYKLQISILK